MDIHLTSDLEAVLNELAQHEGTSPQDLALRVLRESLLVSTTPLAPADDWERIVLGVASDCGVSLPHEALSSEGLYE